MDNQKDSITKVCEMYLHHKISADTFSTITRPMRDLSETQKEWIASKIMDLAENMISEEDLTAKVQTASPQWAKEAASH